ncbi:MAG: hydrogenase maturation protease [Candidatus Latescibacterota bacterium]
MEKAKKPFLVLGLGNVLLGDDGVGIRVVEALKERILPRWVEVISGGVAGHRLMDWLEGVDKAVIVDAARMGKLPGTVMRFKPEETSSPKCRTRPSLHEGDILQTLELAKLLGIEAKEVIFYGVQPGQIDPGEGLSPEVQRMVPDLVARVLEEVAAFGLDAKGKYAEAAAE